MKEFRYDTYCGIYCGACEILSAYQKGGATHIEPKWEDIPEPMHSVIPPSEIKCHGCKSGTVFAGCGNCPMRNCAMQKKDVENCATCREFPCPIYRAIKDNREILELVEKLPHLKSTIKNLKTMREKGTRQWLVEQERLWRCPECGTSFTWYQAKCTKCGKELASLKDYNNLTEDDINI